MTLIREVFTRIATTLPTAREQLRGQLGLTENPGVADDIPSIQVLKADNSYAWKELSTADHTHSNPGITVKSNNSAVDTDITTVDFSSGFTVAESPENEANISPNFGTSSGTISEGNHTHASLYAPIGATYITQTSDGTLTNEQALGSLATGLVKNTTTTGVLSIATAGTDYVVGTDVQYGSGTPDGSITASVGTLYRRTDANGGTQFYVKASGSGSNGWLSSAKAPRRRVVREIVSYEGASTTSSFVSKGFQNTPTITANSTGNADASSGWWLGHSTSSVTNDVASVVGGTNSGVQWQWAPDLSVAFRTGSSVTSVRYWIGLFSSTPSGSSDPAVSGFGFRFDTGASDTNWQAWSNDGTSTGTTTDTGTAIGGAGTANEFRMIVNEAESAVDFYISGVWVAQNTTNLPAASTSLIYGLYCTTLSASSRALRWGRITLENKP